MSQAPTLLSMLSATRPPDVGGPAGSNRFEFQLSWALCRLLELHASPDNYALLLDYFDDVVELDDAVNPTRVDFYQVKSLKSGNWTVNKLIKCEAAKDGAKASILGKLTRHRKTFAETRRTTFVSNRPVAIKLLSQKSTDDVDSFTLHETEVEPRTKICDAMEAEVQVTIDDAIAEQTCFLRTPLSERDHVTQCMGRTADFLETTANLAAPAPPLYRMLRGQLARRSNDERLPANTTNLIELKLFGRPQMDQLLALVSTQVGLKELVNSIRQNLSTEGIAFAMRESLVAGCHEMGARRLDPTNSVVLEMTEHVQFQVANWAASITGNSHLMDGLNFVRSNVDTDILLEFEKSYSPGSFDLR